MAENFLSLETFEGPLPFLLQLVQKREIDLADISIREITAQFLQRLQEDLLHFDSGAEVISISANLMWLKSKLLLPRGQDDPLVIEDDETFSVIHQLIDYYRFKETAKELAQKEKQQSGHFARGNYSYCEKEKTLGIEHISLEELEAIFKQVLEKTPQKKTLKKRTWLLSDKIDLVKKLTPIPFLKLFEGNSCKEEVIVTFLAVLELMKLSEVCIVRNLDEEICVVPKSYL